MSVLTLKALNKFQLRKSPALEIKKKKSPPKEEEDGEKKREIRTNSARIYVYKGYLLGASYPVL